MAIFVLAPSASAAARSGGDTPAERLAWQEVQPAARDRLCRHVSRVAAKGDAHWEFVRDETGAVSRYCLYFRSGDRFRLLESFAFSPYRYIGQLPSAAIFLDVARCPARLFRFSGGRAWRADIRASCVPAPNHLQFAAVEAHGRILITAGGFDSGRSGFGVRLAPVGEVSTATRFENIDYLQPNGDGKTFLTANVCGSGPGTEVREITYHCRATTSAGRLEIEVRRDLDGPPLLYVYGGPVGSAAPVTTWNIYDVLVQHGVAHSVQYDGSISTPAAQHPSGQAGVADVAALGHRLLAADARTVVVAASYGATRLAGVLADDRPLTVVLVSPLIDAARYQWWLKQRSIQGDEILNWRYTAAFLEGSENVLDQLCGRKGPTRLVLAYSKDDRNYPFEPDRIAARLRAADCRAVDATVVVKDRAVHASPELFEAAFEALRR